MLQSLLNAFRTNPEVVETSRAIARGVREQFLTGLTGSQKSILIASLWDGRRPLLLLTHNPNQAARMHEDIITLLGEEQVILFPGMDTLPHEETLEPEVQGLRARVLARLAAGEALIVVTHFGAIARKVVPPDILQRHILRVDKNGQTSPYELGNHAVELGYERVDRVEGPGQFARRGGIVDIWPPTLDMPRRIEFFGDEIESIRSFDVDSQRSAGDDAALLLWPTRDTVLDKHIPIAEKLRTSAAEQAARLRNSGLPEAGDRLELHAAELIERYEQLSHFPGQDQLLPFTYDHLATLLDYLPGAFVVVDEPLRIQDYGQALERETLGTIMGFIEKGLVLREEVEVYAPFNDVMARVFEFDLLALSVLPKTIRLQRPERTEAVPVRVARSFHGKADRLVEEVRRWQKDRIAVMLMVNDAEQGRHLSRMLSEEGLNAVWDPDGSVRLVDGIIVVTAGKLESGFESTQPSMVLLTVQEIYGRQLKKKRARFTQEGVKIAAYTDLRAGDFVVHVNHGIGQYLGMKTLVVAGVHRDYLHVQYSGGDMLYVPVEQVNLLQKYLGAGEDAPKLHKLGGTDWQKTKTRVKESVREMADGLLKLYAEREATPGYEFGPDTPWQREFEDAFSYEETPDQLKAIIEIKDDMERATAMDRLLCGDVGYGKTEVAIRAAFKTVDNGKQVAVLVPTTILAQQHYQTFSDRFAGFPAIRIRAMSRFQSAREQKETATMVTDGRVDVLIGTHRLLSSDIRFKDLGLLIIDEEQRFGVAHKERLKELKKNVDVLTLTATPIPRTLHMALVGVRNMSVIETPPEDRYPVRTYVTEFNDGLVQDAIHRELARGGQIYFVYNRVETIDQMASHIQNLVPEARILIGHGQMSEDALERVMLDFIDGEADILLCTTIIESGMDIPNVNTLIVYDSDHLGLAQLYQLRGRVGRSNRIAYAYFTYRKDKSINEVAEKRLQAIRDFTDLGSGFKIAMRDLEIRGAGNLLGAEQHGHIASVGFEMYCRLLDEAVQELRGEQKPEPPETTVELPVDAYLPDGYISDTRQKVELYKKIAAIRNKNEAAVLREEMDDRFGEAPEAAANLVTVAELRARFRVMGVQSITVERGTLIIRFYEGISPQAAKLHQLFRHKRLRMTYHGGKNIQLRIQGVQNEPGGVIPLLQNLVLALES